MKPRGIGFILYGVEGIGKTSLAAQFPGPHYCISVNESGFEDLKYVGILPPETQTMEVVDYDDLLSTMRDAKDEGIRTVIVDSLSGVSQFTEQKILEDIYSDESNPEKAFASFSEGWRLHAPRYMQRIEEVSNLLRSKGINIILIGHTKIEKGKNIISDDYQSAMLNMEQWPRAVLTKWAQAVLFMTMDFSVRATKAWRGKVTESKVDVDLDDDVDRVIYTTKHPSHSAKNRLGLPSTISMGESAEEAYKNLVSVLPPIIQEDLSKE